MDATTVTYAAPPSFPAPTPAPTTSGPWFERDGRLCKRTVYVINATTATYSYVEKCSRCGGAGASERWARTGSTCYECGGSGRGKTRSVKVYVAEKLAKLDASATKRAAAKEVVRVAEEEAKDAAIRAWRDAHAVELEAIKPGADVPFIASLLAQAQTRPLSEAQLAAGVAAAEREIARRATAATLEWVGAVGARVTLTWTTDKVIPLDGDDDGRSYGRFAARAMVLGHDEKGNRLKYIGAGRYPGEGATVKVTFTVKEHATYRGTKQTVIQRPVFAEAAEG